MNYDIMTYKKANAVRYIYIILSLLLIDVRAALQIYSFKKYNKLQVVTAHEIGGRTLVLLWAKLAPSNDCPYQES
jgi:hypothetical protein